MLKILRVSKCAATAALAVLTGCAPELAMVTAPSYYDVRMKNATTLALEERERAEEDANAARKAAATAEKEIAKLPAAVNAAEAAKSSVYVEAKKQGVKSPLLENK